MLVVGAMDTGHWSVGPTQRDSLICGVRAYLILWFTAWFIIPNETSKMLIKLPPKWIDIPFNALASMPYSMNAGKFGEDLLSNF